MGQIDIRVREPATPKPNLANRFGFSDCVIASSVPLLTGDSQIGANLRFCADEENRADLDQRG
jgi:hypothetical protein